MKISNCFDKISIFSKNFDNDGGCPKFFTKMNIFENLEQNLDFPKIGTKKIRDFRKFWKKISGFSKISIELRIC